jgi:integrase/recombinase XerD
VLIYHPHMATDHLQGYAFRLKRQGLAPRTIVKYEAAATDYVAWLDGTDPVTCRRPDIESYLDEWADRVNASPASVRVRITALSKFYDFLDSKGLLVTDDGHELRNPCDRVERPKSKRKANDHLSEQESRDLLAACSTPQECALLDVLRWSGVRISEACALTWADYDGRDLRVRESKTASGIRTIPVFDELRDGLATWRSHLESRKLYRPDGPILVTRNGTPMHAQYAWRLLKRTAARAGVRVKAAPDKAGHNVSAISAHTLRRTWATDMLNRGVRVEVVSHALGHADTRTTQIHYAELANETARAELLAARAS